MARKTKQNIEGWVARAIRSQFLDGSDTPDSAGIETTYEHNQGDYERVRAHLPDIPIEADRRYEQTVDDRTIRFEVRESGADDDYLLLVRID